MRLDIGRTYKGYFGFNDYEKFIDAAQHNPTCPAHSMRSYDPHDEHNKIVRELEDVLEKNSKHLFLDIFLIQKIYDLDKKSGNLFLHILQFTPDLFKSIQHHQQLITTILQNEEKRLGKNALTLYDENFARTQQRKVEFEKEGLGAEEKSKKYDYKEIPERISKKITQRCKNWISYSSSCRRRNSS